MSEVHSRAGRTALVPALQRQQLNLLHEQKNVTIPACLIAVIAAMVAAVGSGHNTGAVGQFKAVDLLGGGENVAVGVQHS